MTGEGVNAKVLPPSAQLLGEHDIHQLRVGVLLIQQNYVGAEVEFVHPVSAGGSVKYLPAV